GGDAAVWRRAVLQGIEEEAEARARSVLGHADGLEDEPLHVLPVDTDRAARDLYAVDDRVVSLGANLAEQVRFVIRQRALKEWQVFVERRGERVVHRIITPVVLVILEHRKLR